MLAAEALLQAAAYARASLAEGLRLAMSSFCFSRFARAASSLTLASSRPSQQSSALCPRFLQLAHTGISFLTGTPLRPRFAPGVSPRSCAWSAWTWALRASNSFDCVLSASSTSALNTTFLSLLSAPASSLRCRYCSARLMATSVSSSVSMWSSSCS